jgi:hypothetical protein
LITIKNLIRDTLKLNKPHRTVRVGGANNTKVVFSAGNYDKLETLLDMYEKFINQAKEMHGFSNPDMDGGDLF